MTVGRMGGIDPDRLLVAMTIETTTTTTTRTGMSVGARTVTTAETAQTPLVSAVAVVASLPEVEVEARVTVRRSVVMMMAPRPWK
jgi:poly(3-hydroxybutyrate) depolymerase